MIDDAKGIMPRQLPYIPTTDAICPKKARVVDEILGRFDRKDFGSSSVAEPPAVNRAIGGSNPSFPATTTHD